VSLRALSPIPLYVGAALVLALAGAGDRLARAEDEAAPKGIASWFNPTTAPFIPVPEIDHDPNSGLTLGLIPTWLVTDDKQQITRIIAPDVLYNPYFGYGVRGRIYAFPSNDAQWSTVAGAKERVESEFDSEYQTGRSRNTALSFNTSVVYDRSGTPRFYGIGNSTPESDQTNYTLQQMYAQVRAGWNLSRRWQIAYTMRAREVKIQEGTLDGIPSLDDFFGPIPGVGTTHETLSRIEIVYDTRDDTTIPTRGGAYVLYAGVAARDGVFDTSLYSESGLDARQLWTLGSGSTIAAHAALRYMPGTTNVPFWSMSNIGGDQSILDGSQPLRGYGDGRFYDRNSFSTSVEYRRRVLTVDAVSTHIDIELTPFVDFGQVFAHSRDSPVAHLHHVWGLGFRGIASPFVVGYVDVGYGSEGGAVFTGINYPF
jgi:outer membrane protein assembly factor BamA